MASRGFSQQLGMEMVKLTVGTGAKTKEFVVHKDLITEKIPVFGKLFNGPSNEAQTCSATFPEDDPSAFELMIEWAYRGTLTVTLEKSGTGSNATKTVIEIYLLAAKYLLEELADRSLGALIEYHASNKRSPLLAHISAYFGKLSKESMFRKYLTQIWTYAFLKDVQLNGKSRSAEEFAQTLKQNDDFMVGFLKSAREQFGEELQDPRQKDLCDFHVHEKADECPYPGPSVEEDSITI